MTLRISAVAVCCSSASSRSRVSRATSVSRPTPNELRRRTVFGLLRRFSAFALRRRGFIGSPSPLERRFTASPWAW